MASSSSVSLKNPTLYMGGLKPEMNESYFFNDCFPEFNNEIVKVTLKKHASGYGFGFVEFSSHEVAKKVLETYGNKEFFLDWSKEKKGLPDSPSEGENFILEVVGALPKDITKEELHQFFRAYYPSVKGAELRFSESLGRYGIVKFGNKHERDLATIQTHMQSFRKRKHGKSQHFFYRDTATGYQRAVYPSSHLENADSVQSTIYIQNLKKDVCERVLRDMFSDYGQIIKVTLKSSAIIQFAYRLSADLPVGRMKECVSAPLISDVEDFEIVRVTNFKEGDLENGIKEFTSHKIAEKVLVTHNIEREEEDACQKVCLSWKEQKWLLQRKNVFEGGYPDDYNLVVSGEVLKDVAVEQFQRRLKICYPSVKDRVSKSQGADTIIKFSEEHERDLATVEMNMQYFRGGEYFKSKHNRNAACDTHWWDRNSFRPTYYIQNLEKDVSEVQLRDMFSQFGPITKVTLQQCALIQFNNRLSANEAEGDLKAGLVLPVSMEQADEDSPKDHNDIPNEDGGTSSAYNTCDEEFSNEGSPSEYYDCYKEEGNEGKTEAKEEGKR